MSRVFFSVMTCTGIYPLLHSRHGSSCCLSTPLRFPTRYSNFPLVWGSFPPAGGHSSFLVCFSAVEYADSLFFADCPYEWAVSQFLGPPLFLSFHTPLAGRILFFPNLSLNKLVCALLTTGAGPPPRVPPPIWEFRFDRPLQVRLSAHFVFPHTTWWPAGTGFFQTELFSPQVSH